ncbi:MAG: histidinol-phosphate transaminase [Nitrospirae bacterium]|nr:MAG: histidinol-phosphate transaminase [Nitrospirota bacterium]
MIGPPENIKSITPYVPGKPVEELERELGIEEAIKLASNENPLGPSPKALEAIKNHLPKLHRYPEGGAYYLRKALSERLEVDEQSLIFGNGSNELLDIAARTFMTPEDEAVMAWPSFIVYPLAVQVIGAKAIKVALTSDLRHDLRAMADAITDKTKLLFIANPNNPTGTINYSDEFDAFMKDVPEDVLVVVDEAYYEYVQDSRYPDTLRYLKEGKNLLILRTFSKAYGLAGLRIGYGITKPEIVTEMNKVREPFNTNSLAQVAALAALDDQEHLKKSIEINEEGKRYLYQEFERLGLSYVPTETNFIFVKLSGITSQELYGRLLKRGVIIRPIGEDSVRITIGLPEENRKLIEALEAIKF